MQSDQARTPVERMVELCGDTTLARVDKPSVRARCLPAPTRYLAGATGDWIRALAGAQGELYRHQTLALETIDEGANLVIATGTASGKSQCFMLPALDAATTGAGKTLVFYPQKALASDQLSRWRSAAQACGLSPETVGELNGDVPVSERELVLESCQIILATPDVCHAWLMPQLGSPRTSKFLRDLAFIVIDEAHSLEGIFGTNFALFFRRFRRALLHVKHDECEPQVIATSATLHDPERHLFNLTGLHFELIGEEDCGAPAHTTALLHINGPDRGGPAESALAETITCVIDAMSDEECLIAFADSRQGIERIIRRVDRHDVKPYRAGLSRENQREIIDNLRSGALRAVGATNAFELGIDVGQFTFGLNLGVPPSRKALRQRLGRVGRSFSAVFGIIAPDASFAKIGSSLEESAFGPVEPCPLYLDNQIIQFQHAMCLLQEGPEGGEHPEIDLRLNWPSGFEVMLKNAVAGAARPKVLDDIAAIGLDNPHIAYPLRSMPGLTFLLKEHRSGNVIGTIDHEKALREAYPGATYYHFGTAYRVIEMRFSSFEAAIKLKQLKSAEPTWPILSSQIGVSFDDAELIENHLLESARGAFAETAFRVLDCVEGFRAGNVPLYYSELSKQDRRLSRKRREFSTTGVILRINEPWFAGSAEKQVATRRRIADALKEIHVHEYSISPGDLRTAQTGIALHSFAGTSKLDNALVLFDNVVGGMRLTAPIFTDFPKILERLGRGARLAGEQALLDDDTVCRLRDWYASLKAADNANCRPLANDPRLIIFAPDSWVSIRSRGETIERHLIEPQLVTTGSGEQLMYRYETSPGVQAWVAHDHVEAVGNAWQRARWDPFTNEIELMETDHGTA